MTRRRWAGWLAGVSLLVAACGADDPVGDPLDATVGVRASGCSLVDRLGTGAVVRDGDRTVVVTSAHTVAGSDTIVVERANRQTTVELVALDTERDLAILTAPGWSTPGRPLAAPVTGEPARIAVWSPDTPISVADTEVTRLLRVTIEDIYVEGEHERRAFEVAAAIVRGDSGAPVFADDGSILGVVYARSRDRGGVAFAVSSLEIDDLLATTGAAAVDSNRCV